MLHRFDYSKHFSIVDVIVAFRRVAFTGPKGHRVETAVVGLADDAGECKTRGIGEQCRLEIWIEVAEDGSGYE
jgi:hypothetical protein